MLWNITDDEVLTISGALWDGSVTVGKDIKSEAKFRHLVLDESVQAIGVFNRTNLSDIYWYGDIKKLNCFLKAMVSNESSFHPDYNAITIHVCKDSLADTDGYKWRFRNEENHLDVKFKIIKDL